MNRGVKVRIVAFLVLSAVGIVYIAGSYLGLVDKVLGRGLHRPRHAARRPAGCSRAAR